MKREIYIEVDVSTWREPPQFSHFELSHLVDPVKMFLNFLCIHAVHPLTLFGGLKLTDVSEWIFAMPSPS